MGNLNAKRNLETCIVSTTIKCNLWENWKFSIWRSHS